jgi:microcystin-dependent protein
LLFSKIGYTFGGSGSVFRLPDLRGEFIRNWDGGRGVDAGRTVGSFQTDSLKSHAHTYVEWYGNNNVDGPDSTTVRSGDITTRVGVTSATGEAETRPRNVALVACIKVFGEIDEPDQVSAAAIINYVNSIPNYTITSGNTIYSTSGFTNQVGSWNNGANYFDVFPPAGKSMANLVAFMPSIAVIHYAGGVNGDDSMRCTWSNLGDRIRVYVQNTEQRSTPAANYLAIWR